jgi:hypothetical protein
LAVGVIRWIDIDWYWAVLAELISMCLRVCVRSFLFVVSALFVGIAAAADDVLLFPYFLNNGETGVYLASSSDGRRFESLNEGKPIFTPPEWPDGQHLTRDPSIVYHDGKFHMVWTSNWSGRVFGYASSPDLVTWSEPLKVTPFDPSLPDEEQPDNVWAPELSFDPVQKDFQILFSSTVPREEHDGDGSEDRHGNDHRIYSIRTKDFKSFSKPAVLFDQNFSVIDGQMALDDRGTESGDDDRWVMAIKREQNQPEGKNLRLSFNNAAQSDDWTPASKPILGPGSPLRPKEQVEGPSLVRFSNEWLLYADAFTSGHYTLIISPDLEGWTDETKELKIPARHPRHGTFFVVDRELVGWKTTEGGTPGASSDGRGD